MRRKLLASALVIAIAAISPAVLTSSASAITARGHGYRSWLRGNPADVDVAVQSGAMLEGGAKDLRDAWSWFLERAGYGDIVIICATCTKEYNPYVMNIHPVDSVQTLKITKRIGSSDPFVVNSVSTADGIFFAGGDQSDYLRIWNATPVSDAINAAIARGVPIGGISAGLAISGQFYFSAYKNTVVSKRAMENCYGQKIQLRRDLIRYPPLADTITDSHFTEQGRLGRLLTFMSRILTDRWAPVVRGIGIDEATAVLLDAAGQGRVIGTGNASFIRMDRGDVVTCAPATPVSTGVVRVDVLHEGQSFDLTNWTSPTPPTWAQINDGVLTYPVLIP
ncbi:MAG: cyanophycinase [Actinomycetota bacterium]